MSRPEERTSSPTPSRLGTFGVTPERGFLPTPDPLEALPAGFAAWEDVARDTPKFLAAGRLRGVLDRLPRLDTDGLRDEAELERAMLLLSFFGHGYVWGEGDAAHRVPPSLAVPWYEVARRLGRPPVLSYASYALHNWRRFDPTEPIALGNISLVQNFLGGLDEEWFILVHVEIEARAGAALSAAVEAQKAVTLGEIEEAERHLDTLHAALQGMHATLLRMPEGCDPYIYYHRVRPYLHGSKDNPALPDGLVYEGVEAYGGRPQRFRGETGAQSSMVPVLDAALGVAHRNDPLRPYLLEMRDYMPPRHRAFIDSIERGPSVREFVLQHNAERPSLGQVYNQCVRVLAQFRSTHLEYAAHYIQRQRERGSHNPTHVGTGGTPFMPYLKKHRDETEDHVLA